MRRFDRQAEPSFWGEYERRWLYDTVGAKVDPLSWEREKRSLSAWFHAGARRDGEPRRCAYCDGPLGLESPATIDHFFPKAACRALALTWDNLFPACSQCNSTYKGTRWSCSLVRPDLDPVEEWIDFHEETGRLAPAPHLDRRTRARIRLTLRVLGLNATERCVLRKRFLRQLHLRWIANDLAYVEEALTQGPYRFVASKFRASKKRFHPLI